MEERFRTTVGESQSFFYHSLSSTFYLEWLMTDALEEYDGKVSIGGINITNLTLSDDVDALAEEEQELETIVESLDKTC